MYGILCALQNSIPIETVDEKKSTTAIKYKPSKQFEDYFNMSRYFEKIENYSNEE